MYKYVHRYVILQFVYLLNIETWRIKQGKNKIIPQQLQLHIWINKNITHCFSIFILHSRSRTHKMHQRLTYITSRRFFFFSCILISDIEKFSLRSCWIQIVTTPVTAAKILFSAQLVIYLACTCTSYTIKQYYQYFGKHQWLIQLIKNQLPNEFPLQQP